MRDIRFRGRRIDNGEWVYGDLIHSRTKVKSVIVDDEGFGRAVDPETVGQYTGLKDRDSKEIYARDIAENNGQRYEIVYRDDMAMFMVRVIKGTTLTKGLCFGLWQYKQSESSNILDLEIIGNGCEHPDLLGGRT